MKQNKAQFRQTILQRRRQLSDAELASAAQALSEVVNSNLNLVRKFAQAKRILSYWPFKGEISPKLLIDTLDAKIFLPKVVDYQNAKMAFYPAHQNLVENRYGINEPVAEGDSLPIQKFDILLVPLVAFDQHGHRVGMGGGFYDRALAHFTTSERKPLTIGLAHDFQEVDSIQPEVWDVRLDVILTNQKIIDPTNLLAY